MGAPRRKFTAEFKKKVVLDLIFRLDLHNSLGSSPSYRYNYSFYFFKTLSFSPVCDLFTSSRIGWVSEILCRPCMPSFILVLQSVIG